MPIYEYRCDRGHTFEVLQRISDDPLTACERCEAPVRRVFHPVAVHFKGSGFYTTDYGRKRGGGAAADGSEGGGGGSEGGGDSKGDSSGDKKGGSGGESAKAASADS